MQLNTTACCSRPQVPRVRRNHWLADLLNTMKAFYFMYLNTTACCSRPQVPRARRNHYLADPCTP